LPVGAVIAQVMAFRILVKLLIVIGALVVPALQQITTGELINV